MKKGRERKVPSTRVSELLAQSALLTLCRSSCAISFPVARMQRRIENNHLHCRMNMESRARLRQPSAKEPVNQCDIAIYSRAFSLSRSLKTQFKVLRQPLRQPNRLRQARHSSNVYLPTTRVCVMITNNTTVIQWSRHVRSSNTSNTLNSSRRG